MIIKSAVAVAVACVAALTTIRAQAQTVDLDGAGAAQPGVPSNVQPLSPTGVSNGLFNIAAAKRLLNESDQAVSAQNYTLASSKLQEARQLTNQLSNFYQALSASFLGVDSRASTSLRNQALETAQIRDQATYQLALVYRAQNQPDKAIPLLIEIVRSQNPSRELGQKSYQQLFELGFVEVPYPRTQPTTGENK